MSQKKGNETIYPKIAFSHFKTIYVYMPTLYTYINLSEWIIIQIWQPPRFNLQCLPFFFLADLDDFKTNIRDIFVIEKDSGLRMASAHAEDSQGGDGDIFSGMVTAIKGFGEDVFNKSGRGKQELEFIDYESHKIFLQSHHNYYFAVLLNGSMSTSEKNKLADQFMDFASSDFLMRSS